MHPDRTASDFSDDGLKRRLRAVFAADVANFSGRVSVGETRAFGQLSTILRIGREELQRFEGVLIGMPGDGLFALFESAVDALRCALATQERLATHTELGGMKLRIGIHLGEVLFDHDLPFGETLNIAARLESLADPGGILVSAAVVDAVSARIAATFEARGMPRLKNIPRRIATFSVNPTSMTLPLDGGHGLLEPLDRTMRFSRRLDSSPGLDSSPDLSSTPAPMPPLVAVPLDRSPTPVSAQAPAVAQQTPSGAPSAPAPADPAASETPPLQAENGAPQVKVIPQETVAILSEALAVHLGPVARVLVTRKMKSVASVTDLISALEAEIPTQEERSAFRARIFKQLEL